MPTNWADEFPDVAEGASWADEFPDATQPQYRAPGAAPIEQSQEADLLNWKAQQRAENRPSKFEVYAAKPFQGLAAIGSSTIPKVAAGVVDYVAGSSPLALIPVVGPAIDAASRQAGLTGTGAPNAVQRGAREFVAPIIEEDQRQAQIRRQEVEDVGASPMVAEALYGVGKNVPLAVLGPAAPAAFGAEAYSDAIHESGGNQAYADRQAAIMSVLGKVVGSLGKVAPAQTWTKLLANETIKLAKTTGELGLMDAASQINAEASGVRPDEPWTWDRAKEVFENALLNAGMMQAAGYIPHGVNRAVAKRESGTTEQRMQDVMPVDRVNNFEQLRQEQAPVDADVSQLDAYRPAKFYRNRKPYFYETPAAEQAADRAAKQAEIRSAKDVESGMSEPASGEFTYERHDRIPPQIGEAHGETQDLGTYGDLQKLPLERQVEAVRGVFGRNVPTKNQIIAEFGGSREDAQALRDLAYPESTRPQEDRSMAGQETQLSGVPEETPAAPSRRQMADQLGVEPTQLPPNVRTKEGRARAVQEQSVQQEAVAEPVAEEAPAAPRVETVVEARKAGRKPQPGAPYERVTIDGREVFLDASGVEMRVPAETPKAEPAKAPKVDEQATTVVKSVQEINRGTEPEAATRPAPAAAKPAEGTAKPAQEITLEDTPESAGRLRPETPDAVERWAGTEQAHERLKSVVRALLRKSGRKVDENLVDDLAQDALINIIENSESYNKDSGTIGAWADNIARNGTIDNIRKGGRRGRIEDAIQQERGEQSAPPADEELIKREEAKEAYRNLSEKQKAKAREKGINNEEDAADVVEPKDTVGFMGWTGNTGGLKPIASWFKRMFASAGLLPKEVHKEAIIKDAKANAIAKEAQYAVRDLHKAINAEMHNATEADFEAMDGYLKGNLAVALPPKVTAALDVMRSHVDSLSQRLIDIGAAEGDLAIKIEKNKGVYLTRSYQAFDNPDWAAKVKKEQPQVVRAARAAIKKLDPTLTDEQVDGAINNLLTEGKAAESADAVISRSKLGSKDLSQFIGRKDLPQWLRDLFGEYKDPTTNYLKTVVKTANIVANHEFQQAIRKAGAGKFFFGKPTGEYAVRIASEDNPAFKPLLGNGPLYTTLEIKKAFEEVVAKDNPAAWLSALIYVNGAVKAGKTVFGGPTTILRNFTSNAGFMLANGHLRPAAFASTAGHLMNLAKDQAAWRKAVVRYTRLGIIGDSVGMGEVRDAIDRYRQKFGDARSQMDQGAGQRMLDFVQELYAAGDDVWKIYFFENEVRNYSEAYKGKWTQDQIERKAAEITRNTLPTYSLLPKGIKMLRRAPILGTFVAFPWEVYRTAANTLALTKEELSAPETRMMGARRLAGIAAATAVPAALATAAKSATGMTGEEEEDARKFLPPWSKNNQIIWLSKEKGKARYIDMGFQDPYSNMRAAVIAFMRGKNPEESATEALKEVAGPFVDWNLTTKSLLNVVQNRQDTGKPVYNEEAPRDQKIAEGAKYLWKQFQPGFISQALRIYEGTQGTKNLSDELVALSGVRINTLDVNKALFFRSIEYKERAAKAKLLYTGLKNKGIKGEELEAARETAEKAGHDVFNWMQEMSNGAESWGLSKKEAAAIMHDAGLSETEARRVSSGKYVSPIKKDKTPYWRK